MFRLPFRIFKAEIHKRNDRMRASKNKSLAKKKCDRYFSKYIRKRDTDYRGIGQCITCGKHVSIKSADAGHFIRRDREATRYDERNVNLQCRECNRFKSGEQFEHAKAIDEKYGEGTADELLQKSKMRCRRRQDDYEWLSKEFKEKLESL